MSFCSFSKVGQYGHLARQPHQRALEDSPSVSFAPCKVQQASWLCQEPLIACGWTVAWEELRVAKPQGSLNSQLP